jgi:Ca2+-binding RTX toxin-like protein
VKIDNNLVYMNNHWHGIGVSGAHGLSITNNTVVSRTGDKSHLWIKAEDATGVTIAGNVTDEVVLSSNATGSAYGNLELRGDAAAADRIPHLNKGAATTVQDLLIAGYGYQPGASSVPPPSPAPAPTPTPAPPPAQGGEIYGSAASQTVRGTAGADIIYGVGKSDGAPGDNSRDKLYGRGGADIFVFGDHRGVFYDNANSTASGRWDFAQIMDFGKDDRIRLSGSASDYVFRRETVQGKVGTAIFKDNGNDVWDNADELIGHVAGVTLSPSRLIFTGSGSRSGTLAEADLFLDGSAAEPLLAEPEEDIQELGPSVEFELKFADHFGFA